MCGRKEVGERRRGERRVAGRESSQSNVQNVVYKAHRVTDTYVVSPAHAYDTVMD